MASSRLHYIRFCLAFAVVVLILMHKSRAEPRGIASLSPRKPPFNGSIFGKRSVSPALVAESVAPNRFPDYIHSSRLAYLIRQQELLMQAFINHCIEARQFTASPFCTELMGSNNLQQIDNRDGARDGSWTYEISASR